MGQSPLEIESYHLRRLEFQVKEDFEAPGDGGEMPDPKIKVEVESARHKEDNNDWRISIDISGGDEPDFPYKFDISFVGYFRVSDSYPEDKRGLLVAVNGPSILFAAAREFLAIVTARSPYAPIM